MENNLTAWKSAPSEKNTPHDAKNALDDLSRVVLDCDDKEIIRKVLSIVGAYGAYERSSSPVILEDVVAQLAEIIRELLQKPDVGLVGNGCGDCPYARNAKGGIAERVVKNNNGMLGKIIYFEDLERAFFNKLREDALEKSAPLNSETKKEPSTVRIYTTCIKNELCYNNGEYNLTGEITSEKVKVAIEQAIARLKREAEEGIKIDKNSLAALKKLRNLLPELMRALGE